MPYKNPEDEIKWRTSDFGRKWIKDWNLKNKEKLREYYKKWELENKDKRKDQHQKWYKKNIEEVRKKHTEYNKKYREIHAEEIKLKAKEYHKRNKERENEYAKEYRKNHPEKMKEYYQKNREKILEKNRNQYQKTKEVIKQKEVDRRLKVYNHYSNYDIKCICCGERHLDFLSVDHINNDGYEHRKRGLSSNTLIQWIIKNNFPSGFQISCMNCNHGRSRSPERICVHQKELSEKILS